MKKKIIIPIVVCLIIVLGIVGFIFYNNQVVSTITLDINPSIEIGLARNGKVREMKALNEDAKSVLPSVYKGVSLENVISRLTLNVIDKGFAEDGEVVVLVHTENTDSEKVKELINQNFNTQEIRTEVIVVETITEEDKALAEQFNITPAKAAYINETLKEQENINIDQVINRPVNEIAETKRSGNYCDEGYSLEGGFCKKEIERIPAEQGETCDKGTVEYQGKCYQEAGMIDGDRLECHDTFTLEGDKCTRVEVINAEPDTYSCPSGTRESTMGKEGKTGPNDGDYNNVVCVDESNATHPMSPCELHDDTEVMQSGGKCYWHRAPVIASGCPGKIRVGDMCWDDASNILVCKGARDGKQYSSRSEYCEGSVKYLNPKVTSYKCPSGYTLDGAKCNKNEVEDAHHNRVCPEGFTLIDERCLNTNNAKDKVIDYVCNQENSKLVGNNCVIYEIIESHHS